MMVLNPQTLSLKYFTQGDTELFQKDISSVKPDNREIFGLAPRRIFCYNGQTKQIKNFTSTNSQLPEGNVYEVSFDSTGKGWIATETGMCIYDPASQNFVPMYFRKDLYTKIKYVLFMKMQNITFTLSVRKAACLLLP